MVINQWVPAAHKGDTIGDSARHVRSLPDGWATSELRSQWTTSCAGRPPVRSVRCGTDDVTIFTRAALADDRYLRQASRKAGAPVCNVTPAHFFAPYDPALFRLARSRVRS